MNKNSLMYIPVNVCPEFKITTKGIEYIVTAEIYDNRLDSYQEVNSRVAANFKEILIVTFYHKKNRRPEFRVFADKEGFITEMLKEERWSQSTTERLMPYDWPKRIVYANEQSRLVGVEYLENGENDTIHALLAFQSEVRKSQLEKKHARLQMRTDAIMDQIENLPKDMDSWINKVPLLSSRYIYYKRKGKKINGFCTACSSDVVLDKATHNKKGKCPNCKSKITFKAEGKSKNIWDESSMALIQRGKGKLENAIIVRCFKITRDFFNHYRNPITKYYEETRYVIKNTTVYMFEYRSSYNYLTGRWDPDKWHQKKTPEIRGLQYLYTNNLEKVLKGTPWQYSCIKDYALYEGAFMVLKYLDEYIKYPSIEYLVKLKLYKIAREVMFPSYGYYSKRGVNPEGKNLKQVLGVEKTDINFIQKYNISSDELLLYKGLKKTGQVMDKDILTWIRNNFKDSYSYFDMERFVCLANYTGLKKAIKYIDHQHSPNRLKENIIRDWEDYILNSNKLGYDLKNNMILFPKDLKEAHDRVADILKKKEQAHFNSSIAAQEEELNNLFKYENKDFVIRAPHSVYEIIDEGSKLSHCVATYVERITKKSTAVLFIRRKDKLDEPFYTMEVKDFMIIQIRGKHNCDMTPEVKKFIEKWKRKVLSKYLKVKVTVPA